MTVSSSTSKVTYSGNGSTTVFPYTFKILSQDEILVQLKNTSTGVITDQVITTHYTVSGVGSSSGGNVTMVTAPASGYTLVITRDMNFTQETDYTEYDTFPADTHETALDRLTMQVQQVKESTDRSVKFDAAVTGFDTTLPTPSAGYALVINDTEDGWDLVTTSSIFTDISVPAGTGMLAKTGAASSALRTITGTSGKITVTNGDGMSGDPTISVDPALTIAVGNVTGMGTGVGTFLATPSSANLKSAVTDETGSGGALVFATSPTLTTPVIGTIADANGNEQIIMNATSSAVNEISITNAATGNPPLIASSGGDTNVALNISSKGTGAINLKSANTSTAVTFQTGTSNQHTTSLSFANTSASRTVTIPDTDIANAVVQRVSTQTGTSATGTTTIPWDNTIPQNTEGDQYMSLAITPKSTSNILKIEVTIILANSAINRVCAALFQDTTANALAAAADLVAVANCEANLKFTHTMTAGTTSSTTFKVRAGSESASTTTFNGQSGTQLFGGVMASSIVITEYGA